MNPAEEYMLKQPQPFRDMLLYLRLVIEQQLPDVELKYKYRIPFFYLDGKPFCYLNQAGDYVDVGFWHSRHLSLHLEKMYTKGRKVMRSLRYRSQDEIDHQVLVEVLADAYSVSGRGFWD